MPSERALRAGFSSSLTVVLLFQVSKAGQLYRKVAVGDGGKVRLANPLCLFWTRPSIPDTAEMRI